MKRVSIAYLEVYERNLIKSIVRVISNSKEFVLVDDLLDGKDIDIYFIDYTDTRSKEVISENSKKANIILITSDSSLLDSSNDTHISIVSRPLNLQKVSDVLNNLHTRQSKVHTSHILNLDRHKNFVINKGEEICLILNSKKEIYHNISNQTLDDWIKSNPNLTVKETMCDAKLTIEAHKLNHTFIYDSLFYLVKARPNNSSVSGQAVISLIKFPNFFPQIHMYADNHKEFYQICFYMFKKQRTPCDIAKNLQIPLEEILCCINMLNDLGYIKVISDIKKACPTNILEDEKPSKVKSIFSKIKTVLRMP